MKFSNQTFHINEYRTSRIISSTEEKILRLHQGIFGLPYCIGDNFVCNSVRWLLEQGAYEGPVQRRYSDCNSIDSFWIRIFCASLKLAFWWYWTVKTRYISRVVQAQYWHDSNAEEEHKKKSIFLADINGDNVIMKLITIPIGCIIFIILGARINDYSLENQPEIQGESDTTEEFGAG